jgi:hypothetical protein
VTRYALCVGINYPGTSYALQGCVNDANDWFHALDNRGYESVRLLDRDATRANTLAGLELMVTEAKFGDRVVFTYSGHGTWVPDLSGDEPDRRDEALCPVDFQAAGVILDDDLAEVFAARRRGVRVTVISDSCHSGTVSRFADYGDKTNPRFIHPTQFLPEEQWEAVKRAGRSEPKTTPRPATGTVLLSGCDDLEFSYDAYIRGRFNGAFTRAALDALPEHATTYQAWHRSTVALLDTDQYPQHPRLFSARWQRYLTF